MEKISCYFIILLAIGITPSACSQDLQLLPAQATAPFAPAKQPSQLASTRFCLDVPGVARWGARGENDLRNFECPPLAEGFAVAKLAGVWAVPITLLLFLPQVLQFPEQLRCGQLQRSIQQLPDHL